MAWKRDPVPWAVQKLTLRQKAMALLFSVVTLLFVFVMGYFVARLAAVLIIRWQETH